MKKAIKYPSTPQFRQVIKNMKNILTFDGFSEDGEVKRKTPDDWVKSYIGTVKIHGTNGSIVFNNNEDVVYQSKNRILSLAHDNNGFMAAMLRVDHKRILEQVKYLCKTQGVEFSFPVEVAGEWAGRGIQSGVAVSEVNPFFTVFGVAVGKDSGGMNWLPTLSLLGFTMPPENDIFNILDFGYWEADIDFSHPELITEELTTITEQVENECPVGKLLGVEGVGEGVVWKPATPSLAKDPGTWFKVKGEKHSVSKVKKLVAIAPEKLSSIQDFIEYAVTENRLQQGLEEVGLDIKSVGMFISWINRDILKEEGDVMKSNGLIMSDVAKYLTSRSREWYLKKVNGSIYSKQ